MNKIQIHWQFTMYSTAVKIVSEFLKHQTKNRLIKLSKPRLVQLQFSVRISGGPHQDIKT